MLYKEKVSPYSKSYKANENKMYLGAQSSEGHTVTCSNSSCLTI
jgi:hypothetical protein